MFQVGFYTMKFRIQEFRVCRASLLAQGLSTVPFQLLPHIGKAEHALRAFLPIFL